MLTFRKLALSRQWLVQMGNIQSNKLAAHPLEYWAESPEIWQNPEKINDNKTLLVYVLRVSSIERSTFDSMLEKSIHHYNLFFLSGCLDDYCNLKKQPIITTLQHALEDIDALNTFLEKNNAKLFYETLDKYEKLQEIFCESIKKLQSYDKISALLCSMTVW